MMNKIVLLTLLTFSAYLQPATVFSQNSDCHVLYVIHLRKCASMGINPESDTCCVSHYFSNITGWEKFRATHKLSKITHLSIENPSEILDFFDFTLFKKLEYIDLYGNDYDVVRSLSPSFYQIKKLKKLSIRGITIPADIATKIKVAYPKAAIQVNQRSQFEPAFLDAF